VEGYLCKFWKWEGFICKIFKTAGGWAMGATRGGLRLDVMTQAMTWRWRQRVDRPGGPGPPVHRGPGEGIRGPFNLSRRFRSDGHGWLRAKGRRRSRRPARRRRPNRASGHQKLGEDHQIEEEATRISPEGSDGRNGRRWSGSGRRSGGRAVSGPAWAERGSWAGGLGWAVRLVWFFFFFFPFLFKSFSNQIQTF
jgi:hypothetical protein